MKDYLLFYSGIFFIAAGIWKNNSDQKFSVFNTVTVGLMYGIAISCYFGYIIKG